MIALEQKQTARFIAFVKGVAILLIMSHHFARSAWLSNGDPAPLLLQWGYSPSAHVYESLAGLITQGDFWAVLMRLSAHFGYVGVHLFVFASGLGLALGTPAGISTRTFLTRRVKKLIPPFWIAIAVFSIIGWAIGRPFSASDILSRLLLLTTLVEKKFFVIDSPTWCLAVFFQLYILFIPLRWILVRYGWIALILIVAIAFNARGITSLDSVVEWNKYFSHAFGLNWLAVFSAGVLFGDALRRGQPVRVPAHQVAPMLVFASASVWLSSQLEFLYPLHDTAIGALSSLLSVLLWRLASKTPLTQGLIAVGEVSFPLFLYHRPIITYIADWWTRHHPTQLLPAYLYILLLGTLIFFFIALAHKLARFPRVSTFLTGR